MAISLKRKKLPVHALKKLRYVFSTGRVCSDKGKTRSVEQIEFQCQGALQRPVHARCLRACVRACVCARFEIVIDFSFQLA